MVIQQPITLQLSKQQFSNISSIKVVSWIARQQPKRRKLLKQWLLSNKDLVMSLRTQKVSKTETKTATMA